MKANTDPQKIDEVLTRRVKAVYPSKEALKKNLLSGKRLRLYQGFDPTGYRLHLGHTIGLRKLMEFAHLNHEVIFLFGTGTVLAGDPSHRLHARSKMLLKTNEKTLDETINKNIKDWQKQTEKIVDFKKVKILKNGDWLRKLTLKDILYIASHLSAVQLFKRNSFQKRLDQGDTVWFHETMYPLLQGYDSVVMDVDLEIGGTDQEFNMLIGRELQRKMKNREKFVLTVPMILGTDGKPMSKTSGNCIWLDDFPENMYGKLMTISDDQIIPYMELVTDISLKRIAKIKEQILSRQLNPMIAKKELAFAVTKQFNGEEKAKEAQNYFAVSIQEKGIPANIPTTYISLDHGTLFEICKNVRMEEAKRAKRTMESNGEIKRKIEQGGVRWDKQKIISSQYLIKIKKNGNVLKFGKTFRIVKIKK